MPCAAFARPASDLTFSTPGDRSPENILVRFELDMKESIPLIIALLIFYSTEGQNCVATFSGKVVDSNNKPLTGVAVILNSGQLGLTTDADGNFIFSNLCAGNYKLQVQYLGFETVSETIKITRDVSRRIYLQQESEHLDEVTIETEVAGIEHAHNTSLLSERDLARTAGKSLGETLKEVPGVNALQTGPGIFKPVIHGVHSQRILILNYGIRQEGQQWGAEHAPEIDPFVAANIAVVKDASSIKYGTDAIGGVVIVNPPELPVTKGLGGTMDAVLQSNGRSGAFSAMIEGGFKKPGWGWRAQGTAKRSGDFHAPRYSLTNTGVSELNFSGATGYHDDKKGVEIFFSHFESELGILRGTAISTPDDLESAMERPEPLYTEKFGYKIREPRQEVSHNLLKLNGHTNLGSGIWRFQYGFQNNNRREFDLRRGTLTDLPSIDLQLNTNTIETEWEHAYGSNKSICMGLSGIYQVNTNVYGTKRIPFIPNFDNLSGGAFAISKFNFENTVVDLGVRYDYRHYDIAGFDSNNKFYTTNLTFHNASATAGATFRLANKRSLTLNLSSAWRPPHVAELYSIGTHQSAAAIEYGLLIGNSGEVLDIGEVSYDNEQALKFVGTYSGTWKDFSYAISPYANYIFNYIYLKPGGVFSNLRGVYPYFRYAQTDALFLGVDFSGNLHISDRLHALPKVSILRASDESNDDYLLFIPANRAELTLRYEKPLKGTVRSWYFEPRVKYVAEQKRAPRFISVSQLNEANEQQVDLFAEDDSNFDFMKAPDAYTLLNASLGISLQNEKVKYDVRLSSENLLNTTYRDYTNRFRYYADDIGRNFVFSLKCIF
jgi:iron complex outermembrane recepter protein